MNFKKSLMIALLSLGVVNAAVAKVTTETVRKYEQAHKYVESGEHLKAFTLVKESAEDGLPEAQRTLGLMYELKVGTKQDLKQAIKWYQKSAEQGDAGAQSLLGEKYIKGIGVKVDPKKARYWFEKAAKQNDGYSQYMLATLYLGGAGGEKNQIKATKYLKLSCQNSYQTACAILNSGQ